MYDKMSECFNATNVIDLCKDSVASETHKWGLAPMHYCDTYYKNVLQEIYRIIESEK